MKIIIAIGVLLTLNFNVQSQERYDVTLKNDTVFNNKKPLFICNEDIKPPHLLYFLRNFQHKTMAVVHFETQDSVYKTSVSFPARNLRYSVYYPKMDVVVLLESFVRNKIIVNGAIDTVGLLAYCKERQILLTSMTQRKAMRPMGTDSTLANRARMDFQSQIPIKILNTSNTAIAVNIGTPSNNRVQNIAPGDSLSERAHAGDNLCILDKNMKSKICRVLKESDKTITINKVGTGFE